MLYMRVCESAQECLGRGTRSSR